MLASSDVTICIPVDDSDRASEFYRDRLGFAISGDDISGVLVHAHGVRIQLVPGVVVQPALHVLLEWQVVDIESTVDALSARGVEFTRHDGLDQDERGIWTVGDGKLAFFSDPDGNKLSLIQSSPLRAL